MQILPSYSSLHYSSEEKMHTRYLKGADLADRSLIEEKKPPYEKENNQEAYWGLPRQTYGLSVLENMSDEEYHAFLRATAEMSESEKILAAQSLYRLNTLKNQNFSNPYWSSQNEEEFLRVFHHAYEAIKQGA